MRAERPHGWYERTEYIHQNIFWKAWRGKLQKNVTCDLDIRMVIVHELKIWLEHLITFKRNLPEEALLFFQSHEKMRPSSSS